MKMIKAIIRPEYADDIVAGLDEAGYYSLTKINVFGRGKQKGMTIGTMHYDEFPKTMIMMGVEDDAVDTVSTIIQKIACTGNYGDGKIFITPVEKVLTIRTGEHGL